MANGSNTPETPGAVSYDLTTEEGRAQVPTQITIKGKDFELKNMSVGTAQELYSLLDADDQARATGLASFIQNFKAPLLSELPEELQQPGKIEEFVKALQAGGGKVTANTPDWVKRIADEATSAASRTPGAEHVRNIMGAIETAQSAASTGSAIVGEAKDWAMLLPRATEYLITKGREAWNTNGEPPTPDQAMAMATAYQGSLVASRRSADFMDKANARLEQFGSWAGNSTIGCYVTAFVTAIGNFVSGKGWNFSEALEAAKASQTESRSYEQILNENLEQPVQATARLRNAEEVAGRPTAIVADTLEAASTNGAALYVNNENKLEVLNDSGQTAAVNGPDGQQIDAAAVDKSRMRDVFGSIGTNGMIAGGIAAVGGLGATYKFGKGATQGLAHRYWGDNNGAHQRATALTEQSDKKLAAAAGKEKGGRWIGPNPDKAEKLLGEAEALEGKAAAASKMGDARIEAHPKLNKFGNGVAEDLGSRKKFWTWPERAGRRMGDMAGAVSEPVIAKLDDGARATSGALDKLMSFRLPAGSVAAAGALKGAAVVEEVDAPKTSKAAAAAKVAEEVVEEGAVKEAGLLARWGGRAARWGAKAVRVLPIVGALGAGGALGWSAAKLAETVNGEKLTGPQQLARDLELGRITEKEYYAWKGLQAAYVGSGLLGFVGGGIVEAVQSGSEHLDGSKVGRYLPPSIVADVETIISESKSSPAAKPAPQVVAAAEPDAGLAAATTDMTLRAQHQAQKVFAAVKSVRHQSGEDVTLADVTPGKLSREAGAQALV